MKYLTIIFMFMAFVSCQTLDPIEPPNPLPTNTMDVQCTIISENDTIVSEFDYSTYQIATDNLLEDYDSNLMYVRTNYDPKPTSPICFWVCLHKETPVDTNSFEFYCKPSLAAFTNPMDMTIKIHLDGKVWISQSSEVMQMVDIKYLGKLEKTLSIANTHYWGQFGENWEETQDYNHYELIGQYSGLFLLSSSPSTTRSVSLDFKMTLITR